MDIFERCVKKVERAIEHLNRLQDLANGFVDEHGKTGILLATEPNTQSTRAVVRIVEVPPIPEIEWGIIIGDAVHCLRSALDQLVSSLWVDPPTRRTGFPICRTEKEWVVEAPGQVWSVPTKVMTVINEAQPYHRGDQAHSHPLAVLNELWNLDKHEAIPAASLIPNHIKIEVDEEKTYGLAAWTKFKTHPGRPLQAGTVLADCGITFAPDVPDAKMEVKSHLTADVGFGQLTRASSVSHKPVRKTFEKSLIPAVVQVILHCARVVHGDGYLLAMRDRA